MKKLLVLINTILMVAFTFAQTPVDSTNSVDSTTSGYSRPGTIGLIILFLGIMLVIMAFTWRKKEAK